MINSPQHIIQTDAGWDRVSYAQACAYFSEEAVGVWWDDWRTSTEIVDILKELSLDPALADDEDFVEDELWSLHPPTVDIVTARACVGNHQWMAIVALPYPSPVFTLHEQKAIELGVALRSYLARPYLIINDNKDAVRVLKPRFPDIAWRRRQQVRRAHQLSLTTATRILVDSIYFTPPPR